MREDFIFFPDSYFIGDPAGWGLPFEDIYFPTSDGVMLHGWFVLGSGETTLLWCHGNAGNISYRLDNLKLLHDRLGVNIFIFDYRGYGRSQGKPSEEGTYRDAEAALTYISTRQDIDQDAVVVFGRSLGGAVAVDLASEHQCLGLILESTFASMMEWMSQSFADVPLDRLPIKYDSLTKIKRVKAPLLMLHGDCDDVVPFQSGMELYESANEPKEFYTIEGAGHNDTYIIGGEGYISALQGFISNLETT
jgi:fermentation-respiration switch protein FrsA (DUF1100 family)